MNESLPLFITGVARGGTTLISRMLNVHKEVAVASDPYSPLFKSLRNAIIQDNRHSVSLSEFTPELPFQDYYFTAERLMIMDLIQAADLTGIHFDQSGKGILHDKIKIRAVHEAPELMPYISGLSGKNYKDIFDKALDIIAGSRSACRRRYVGFKEVWTIEFFTILAKAYPGARFIVILRDPRAVVSSIIKLAEKDPSQLAHPLSVARHWRKYAAFCEYYRNSSISDRFHVMTFERLVREPKESIRELCDFLNIAYCPGMVDTNNYIDTSSNTLWKGNSSFEEVTSGINQEAAERWRVNLKPEAIKMIDLVCGPDMRLFGYEPLSYDASDDKSDFEMLQYIFQINKESYSWRSDLQDPQQDFGFEMFRSAVLSMRDMPGDGDIIRRSFLFEDIYSKLREQEMHSSTSDGNA